MGMGKVREAVEEESFHSRQNISDGFDTWLIRIIIRPKSSTNFHKSAETGRKNSHNYSECILMAITEGSNVNVSMQMGKREKQLKEEKQQMNEEEKEEVKEQ